MKEFINEKYIDENGDEIRIITNGEGKFYIKNNKFHRIDGPAIHHNDIEKYWYYEGKYVNCKTQEEFERILKLKLFW